MIVIQGNRVEYFLEKYVSALEAPTWDRLAEKIGRLGQWEFEWYSG
ncbi:Imm8 family immunity protein [Actinopolyspora erythraea]